MSMRSVIDVLLLCAAVGCAAFAFSSSESSRSDRFLGETSGGQVYEIFIAQDDNDWGAHIVVTTADKCQFCTGTITTKTAYGTDTYLSKNILQMNEVESYALHFRDADSEMQIETDPHGDGWSRLRRNNSWMPWKRSKRGIESTGKTKVDLVPKTE